MAFQPSEEDTKNILQLLRDSRCGLPIKKRFVLSSLSSPNPQVNAAIQQQLEVYNQNTNFNGYLAFIFGNLKTETEEIRSVAGLLLKQNIRNFFANLRDGLKCAILLLAGLETIHLTLGSFSKLCCKPFWIPLVSFETPAVFALQPSPSWVALRAGQDLNSILLPSDRGGVESFLSKL